LKQQRSCHLPLLPVWVTQDAVGAVSQLGQYADLEIVDVDAVATNDEVPVTLKAAIPGTDDDQAVIYERQVVEITGL